MKFISFSFLGGQFWPAGFLIRIPNSDPDPLTQLNPDPKNTVERFGFINSGENIFSKAR
jgi:hypothetical protein